MNANPTAVTLTHHTAPLPDATPLPDPLIISIRGQLRCMDTGAPGCCDGRCSGRKRRDLHGPTDEGGADRQQPDIGGGHSDHRFRGQRRAKGVRHERIGQSG